MWLAYCSPQFADKIRPFAETFQRAVKLLLSRSRHIGVDYDKK